MGVDTSSTRTVTERISAEAHANDDVPADVARAALEIVSRDIPTRRHDRDLRTLIDTFSDPGPALTSVARSAPPRLRQADH